MKGLCVDSRNISSVKRLDLGSSRYNIVMIKLLKTIILHFKGFPQKHEAELSFYLLIFFILPAVKGSMKTLSTVK